jgi:hypothetical protein
VVAGRSEKSVVELVDAFPARTCTVVYLWIASNLHYSSVACFLWCPLVTASRALTLFNGIEEATGRRG